MKSIISASRRTDIPSFYLDWFINAISKGSIQIQNPYYKKNFSFVDLSPSSVEWIVFWSRNYDKFLKRIHFFDDYNLFFHFTIISHHPKLEKSALPIKHALKQIEKLAYIFGSGKIIWRYDPIVFWNESGKLQTNYREAEFVYLCEKMQSFGILNISITFMVGIFNAASFPAFFKNLTE